jgi:hypothetical protein
MSIKAKSQHMVYVNSAERTSGTTDNFTYNVNLPPDKNFNKVVVLDALIPKSYWLVQSGYNTFQLTENGTTVTVTIPVGNYNLTSWRYIIANVLNNASPNGWVYSVSYPNTNTSPDTGLLTYTVTGNGGLQPIFTFLPSNSLYENFGFDVGQYTFSGDSLTSINIIKLQVEDKIFINSDLVQGSPNNFGVLQEINVAPSPAYSSIAYQSTAPEFYAKDVAKSKSSTYSFSLTDVHNFPIHLNGLPFSFTLLFYQEEDLPEKVKSFMKLMYLKSENSQ